MEIWKDIQGFENQYQISSYGRVKSLSRHWKPIESILSLQRNKYGYLKIRLGRGVGNYREYKIHRLVAIHFILNPDNYREVNHIDGNKENNKVENLEWCTRSHNIKHAFKNKLASISDEQKRICSFYCKERIGEKSTNRKEVINMDTKEIYATIKIAASVIDMKPPTLTAMLNGRNPNKTNLRLYHPLNLVI
jgi:hypothetical protein